MSESVSDILNLCAVDRKVVRRQSWSRGTVDRVSPRRPGPLSLIALYSESFQHRTESQKVHTF